MFLLNALFVLDPAQLLLHHVLELLPELHVHILRMLDLHVRLRKTVQHLPYLLQTHLHILPARYLRLEHTHLRIELLVLVTEEEGEQVEVGDVFLEVAQLADAHSADDVHNQLDGLRLLQFLLVDDLREQRELHVSGLQRLLVPRVDLLHLDVFDAFLHRLVQRDDVFEPQVLAQLHVVLYDLEGQHEVADGFVGQCLVALLDLRSLNEVHGHAQLRQQLRHFLVPLLLEDAGRRTERLLLDLLADVLELRVQVADVHVHETAPRVHVDQVLALQQQLQRAALDLLHVVLHEFALAVLEVARTVLDDDVLELLLLRLPLPFLLVPLHALRLSLALSLLLLPEVNDLVLPHVHQRRLRKRYRLLHRTPVLLVLRHFLRLLQHFVLFERQELEQHVQCVPGRVRLIRRDAAVDQLGQCGDLRHHHFHIVVAQDQSRELVPGVLELAEVALNPLHVVLVALVLRVLPLHYVPDRQLIRLVVGQLRVPLSVNVTSPLNQRLYVLDVLDRLLLLKQ